MRARHRLVAFATVALFAVPPIVDVALGGTRRLVGYFAADAFYYLTVARNLWLDGFPSFDRARATNGFHPLWQYALSGVYGLARSIGISDDGVLYVVAFVVLACLSIALYLLARTFASARGSIPTVFVLLPAGLFALAISPLWKIVGSDLPEMNPFEGSAPVWGSLWMAINGMETAALVLSWALLALLFVERPIFASVRAAIALGVVMSLVVLARLDHAPFALFPGFVLLHAARRDPRALARVLACAGAAAIPIGAYVASNLIVFGSAMPVSGSLKTTFPHPTPDNWHNVVELLAASPPGWWLERAARACQGIVPVVAAIALLAKLPSPGARFAIDPSARLDAFLRASAWAVLTLGAYDWLFVPWSAQGHWYFPLSTLFVSLAALRAWAGWSLARELDASPRASLAIGAICAAIALAFFLGLHRQEDYHAHYADFLTRDAPIVRERFADQAPRVVEFDDGVIGWGSGFPSMPASGLTLDPDGARRVHEGGLFPLAVERGHLWFASSIVSVDSVYANVRRSWPRGRAEIVYRAPDGFFGVVRLTPQ